MAEQNCTCTICGSQFKRSPHKANLYCGLACYRVAQRRGDYKRGSKLRHKCSNCGGEVIGVSHSRKRNGEKTEHIFCNRDCYDEFRRKKMEQVYGNCKGCGKSLSRASCGHYESVYCSHECRVATKKAKPKRCRSCNSLFTPVKYHHGAGRMISYNAGKTCSEDCRLELIRTDEKRKEKISKAFTGQNHPNWQGGPQIHHRGARGSGWPKARRAALKRDRYTCQHCGITEADHIKKTGKGLEVNHIRPFWQFGGDNQKANRISNLESLCKSCHQKADWKYRKENPMQIGLAF